MSLDDFDRRLIAATQSGLPLVPRPYEAVGAARSRGGPGTQPQVPLMLAQRP